MTALTALILESELHNSGFFVEISLDKVGSKYEGSKTFLAAPFFESSFSAASCKKRIQKTVQVEIIMALPILTWL